MLGVVGDCGEGGWILHTVIDLYLMAVSECENSIHMVTLLHNMGYGKNV